jgi:hypothetical protein
MLENSKWHNIAGTAIAFRSLRTALKIKQGEL